MWYKVLCPDLPNTDFPIVEDQVESLEKSKLKKWDIIIAHSLGCQVWLKYIEEQKIDWITVIFVAPSYNYLADEIGDDRLSDAFVCMSNAFNTTYNFRQLNKLKNNYTVMLSENDPYINSFEAREYYGQLDNVHFVMLAWKWHFSSDIWLQQFPELLKYI